MFGILNLNKPAGITSRGVVNRVERLVRPAKAGHAGTLDPLATGVLVVCVGPATRLIEYVQRMPKRYVGTFLLGRSSATEDIEGEMRELDNPPQPALDDFRRATERLLGEIEQRPPAFSALKIGGRRAYDLARQGKKVDLAPRKVTIHHIEIVRYKYPELVLDIGCGSGTYVRSLGRDLAESLGTAAVMSALVRTEVGTFHLDEALRPEDLSKETIAGHLQPPLSAVAGLLKVQLTKSELNLIVNGRTIKRATPQDADEIAAVDAAGHLVALLKPRGAGCLGPLRNFPPA